MLGSICALDWLQLKGTYTIIIDCGFSGFCAFGRLGRARLRKGHYLYTGSALGSGAASLEGRLQRHRRHRKVKWWHIDYLTCKRTCQVVNEIHCASNDRLECSVSEAISRDLKIPPVLPGIGSSDCNCRGHLLGPETRSREGHLLKRVVEAYVRVGVPRASIEVRNQIG